MMRSMLEESSFFEMLISILFLLVGVLTVVSLFFSKVYLSKFFSLSILILLIILISIFMGLMLNVFYLMVILMCISFFSLFLIFYGYGVSLETCSLVLFKGVADLCLVVFMSIYIFLKGTLQVSCLTFSSGLEFLLLAFYIYSLCSFLGLWMYWAMDGSNFISCYLHSVGFIAMAMVMYVKLYYLGVLEDFISLLEKFLCGYFYSYVQFMILFCSTKKSKKSMGFYSCAGLSFSFMLLLISPDLGVFYFVCSSLFKISGFELMSLMSSLKNFSKVSSSWLMFSMKAGMFIISSLMSFSIPYSIMGSTLLPCDFEDLEMVLEVVEDVREWLKEMHDSGKGKKSVSSEIMKYSKKCLSILFLSKFFGATLFVLKLEFPNCCLKDMEGVTSMDLGLLILFFSLWGVMISLMCVSFLKGFLLEVFMKKVIIFFLISVFSFSSFLYEGLYKLCKTHLGMFFYMEVFKNMFSSVKGVFKLFNQKVNPLKMLPTYFLIKFFKKESESLLNKGSTKIMIFCWMLIFLFLLL